MNFLITGCAGFIGSNLSEYLPTRGYCVQELKPSTGSKLNILRLQNLSVILLLFRTIFLSSTFKSLNQRFDCIVHLAAQGSVQKHLMTCPSIIGVILMVSATLCSMLQNHLCHCLYMHHLVQSTVI